MDPCTLWDAFGQAVTRFQWTFAVIPRPPFSHIPNEEEKEGWPPPNRLRRRSTRSIMSRTRRVLLFYLHPFETHGTTRAGLHAWATPNGLLNWVGMLRYSVWLGYSDGILGSDNGYRKQSQSTFFANKYCYFWGDEHCSSENFHGFCVA